ncbi:MAG: hypothetical protein PVJ77_12420, partial [Desulfobacterales bacterium]
VGLVRQEREGTVLRCFIEFKQIDAIVSFLTEECYAADPAYVKQAWVERFGTTPFGLRSYTQGSAFRVRITKLCI